MSEVSIYGASDDLVEFDGAIYGEANLNYDTGTAHITLKAPDGVKMKLTAEFGLDGHPDGWKVYVASNPGDWPWREFRSHKEEPDFGVIVEAPEGTTAKCDGKRVR